MKPHLIHLMIDKWGEIGYRVECPGTDEDNGCLMWSEAPDGHVWPGPHQCNCTDPECEPCATGDNCLEPGCATCADGDHYGCGDDWPRVDEIGCPGCQLVQSPGCGVLEYDGEVGPLFAHGPWPAESPVRAAVVWEDGYPRLVPWAGTVTVGESAA